MFNKKIFILIIIFLVNTYEKIFEFYHLSQFGVKGKNISIRRGVIIKGHENISLGENVFINNNVMISAKEKISIGNNVTIGPGVIIHTSNHFGPIFYENRSFLPIDIHNNIWIGAGAIIAPGVTINSNSIIAAGAVVVSDVPLNSIVGGIPAKIIT